jgi:anti-sigma factor RsiW
MQQTELIVSYIRGELTGPQHRDFEQRLLAEPALQAKVQDYRIILQGLKGLQYEAFQREISAWEVEEEMDEDRLLIMDYLAGDLSPAERIAFEQRLINEPALAQTLAEHRTLAAGFKAMRQADFENEVLEWSKNLPVAETDKTAKVIPLAKKRNTWWRYATAAVLLALLAVAIWQLGPVASGGPDLTAFSRDNYIAPAAIIERGNEATLDRAVAALESGDLIAAEVALKTISSADSLYATAQYYLGHTYYRSQRYVEAVSAFTNSLNAAAGSSNYNLADFNPDNAAWTRILAYLAASEETSDSTLRSYLADFLDQADRSDVYYQKARELETLLSDR